jgi:hypothetical protein
MPSLYVKLWSHRVVSSQRIESGSSRLGQNGGFLHQTEIWNRKRAAAAALLSAAKKRSQSLCLTVEKKIGGADFSGRCSAHCRARLVFSRRYTSWVLWLIGICRTSTSLARTVAVTVSIWATTLTLSGYGVVRDPGNTKFDWRGCAAIARRPENCIACDDLHVRHYMQDQNARICLNLPSHPNAAPLSWAVVQSRQGSCYRSCRTHGWSYGLCRVDRSWLAGPKVQHLWQSRRCHSAQYNNLFGRIRCTCRRERRRFVGSTWTIAAASFF